MKLSALRHGLVKLMKRSKKEDPDPFKKKRRNPSEIQEENANHLYGKKNPADFRLPHIQWQRMEQRLQRLRERKQQLRLSHPAKTVFKDRGKGQ